MINNVVLLVAMLTVLFGTLFPLIMDGLGLGKYSVGPPYFNAVFVPLMAVLFVFMGLGPSINWKRTKAESLRGKILFAALSSMLVGLLFPFIYGEGFSIAVALAVSFATWLVMGCWIDLREKLRKASSLRQGLSRLTPSYYGMQLAHFGMACSVIGVCLTSQYSFEQDVRMLPGDNVEVAGFQFQFQGTRPVEGPNYRGDQGRIVVTRDDSPVAVLLPEKRRYLAQQGQMMTEAAIDAGLWRDLYVAMGEPLANGAWAVRIHYKPFVRWMWLGGLLMAAGGVLAITDKRYRMRARSTEAIAVSPSAEVAQ